MTAPTGPDRTGVVARLDALEAAHAAATAGPWREVRDDYGCPHVVTDTDYVCETQDNPADAAAIVAEHNLTPALLAAVRAVLALADEWDASHDYTDAAATLRAAVAAALGEA